jgi:uncharacterized membrane protein
MSLIKWLLLLAALIPAGILFFVMMDMGIDPENGDDAVVMVALGFFAMLPFFYLLLSWAFAPLFIMFYDMEPWHAMEASRKVITRKLFLFFALAFVGGLIAMLGALAIFIGMLFTFPVYMAMTYTASRDIVGLTEH